MATEISFTDASLDDLAAAPGAVVAFWTPRADGAPQLGAAAKAMEKWTQGQVGRLLAKAKGERGEVLSLNAPHRMSADVALLVCRGAESALDAPAARGLGGKIAAALAGAKATQATIRVEGLERREAAAAQAAAEMALGLRLRAYRFETYRSSAEQPGLEQVAIGGGEVEAMRAAFAPLEGVAQGVEFTRDLVNEPANVLTPSEFAERAAALKSLGVKVEVLGERELERIGMRTLLAVGRGSEQESKVAIMRWDGAADRKAAPVCFVGKGVCFDTGGISLKPPAGMEEMTMDMGGAGVVVGVMKALALRKAKANVVGIIGLVENMPDGKAQRPGDIVTSLAGKTVEVINTDAEGRLVLADLLWHAQETFSPRLMVDLATLTGAIIIALGHERAGFFSNDDGLAKRLNDAAQAEGEGIWRMPLGEAYDKALKSRLADMKNTGGRPAGSITAAQFLQRVVKPGQPWAHIDIAGVALTKEPGATWPKGASGWGVATLVRLAEDCFAD